jgi:hypothetical protein
LGIDSSTVYTAVRIARAKNWLTTLGKGVAGGTLSPTGEAASEGPETVLKVFSCRR